MRRHRSRSLTYAGLLLLILASAVEAKLEGVAERRAAALGERTVIFDGSFVHDVGNLQVNVTNWGVLGSFPGSNLDISDAPSAQWPAGSGIEYLYAAGLWVGARLDGIPRVSTGLPDMEFLPGVDERQTVYVSFVGDPGGNRLPSDFADDDADGLVDEDPLNGYDDDGDGSIDEDFAAIADQYFRCTYRDDHEESLQLSADHHPLEIEVTQQSFQWESPLLDDFVGVEYSVRNVGHDYLSQVFLGFFADPDVGSRYGSGNYRDDVVDLYERLHCRWNGSIYVPIQLTMGIAYDKDGDVDSAHPAPGQLGIMVMGHSTDPLDIKAPRSVSMRDWQVFGGLLPYSEGGEPVSDDQRYELLSRRGRDYYTDFQQDYRMLLSVGPFQLEPGDSAILQMGLVVGEGREGLITNALNAQIAFDGDWFDFDSDWSSGRYCRESLLYSTEDKIIWQNPCNPFDDPILVPLGARVWVNADCAWEAYVNSYCYNYYDTWCTGEGGRETNLHWISGSPPPPPNLRLWATEEGVVLFWDDFSESVMDYQKQEYDFEGYMIWRADHWTRPPGSNEETGPPPNLWMAIDEFDIPNGLGADTGLEALHYQPNVDANLVAWYAERLLAQPDIESSLDLLPPTGYSLADADTAIVLARRDLGLTTGGAFYTYRDTSVRVGMPYFYNVTAVDHDPVLDQSGNVVRLRRGLSGSPSNGFVFTAPQSESQPAWDYDPDQVYVVPNPATRESMAPWTLGPNRSDPTGLKVEFRHLPAAICQVHIYTIAGDLVRTLRHDGRNGDGDSYRGSLAWDLVSRNGQQVASGVYIFVVDAAGFPRKTGKFTVIR